MRDSRDKWIFFECPDKPAISAIDVGYWKNMLRKVLKVGTEFEFNLPNQIGTCKGDSQSCTCIHLGEDCWKMCKNKDVCVNTPSFDRCAFKTTKCNPVDCPTCPNFILICHGLFCTDFISQCFGCDRFEIDCEKCKYRYDPGRSAKEIRSKIKCELVPSNSYGLIRNYGVHSIVKDGSLLGDKGAEIITVGRRVDFLEFYKMSKKIIDSAASKGAYVNERCSIHMHILASYYGKLASTMKNKNVDISSDLPDVPRDINELERDMPEIILANFHQLCRRYQNAITWMTTALDEPERMTRWEKFRVSILDVSAILNNMEEVNRKIHELSENKYGWVDYDYCTFRPNGDVARLHIEMRVADGTLCPSAVAAVACLYYAMMIKAVEISRYGVLKVGDKYWMKQAHEIKNVLLNNTGDWKSKRFSDTSNLTHYVVEALRKESLDLIRQLKHILLKTGSAYTILGKLAAEPVSLRRCNGKTWEQIEKELEVPLPEEDRFEIKINEFIDLRLIDECETPKEWIKFVGQALKNEIPTNEHIEEKIGMYIGKKRDEGEIVWSDIIGAMVIV